MHLSNSFPFGSNTYGGALLPGYCQNQYPINPVYIQRPVPQQGSSNANPYADYLTPDQRQFQPWSVQSNNDDLFAPMPPRSRITFGFSMEQDPEGLRWGPPRVTRIGPQQAQPPQQLPMPMQMPPVSSSSTSYLPPLTLVPPPNITRPVEIAPIPPANGTDGKFVWPMSGKPATGMDRKLVWPHPWNPKPDIRAPAFGPHPFGFPKKPKLFKSPKRLQDSRGLLRHRWRLDQKRMLGATEAKRLYRRDLLERQGLKRPLNEVCMWQYCQKKMRPYIRKRPWMEVRRPIRTPSILSPRSVRDRSPIEFSGSYPKSPLNLQSSS